MHKCQPAGQRASRTTFVLSLKCHTNTDKYAIAAARPHAEGKRPPASWQPDTYGTGIEADGHQNHRAGRCLLNRDQRNSERVLLCEFALGRARYRRDAVGMP